MSTDDTVREGKQAREDALAAMLESNLIPGHIHIGMEDEAGVEAMYREVVEKDPGLVVYRVPKHLSRRGRTGGLLSAAIILGMPPNAHGKVMFSFDGYAGDRRELFEIPKVVDFCRGFLLADTRQPRIEHSKRVLSIMLNEDIHAFKDGELVSRRWLDAAGGLWACGCAFPAEVYRRSASSPSGWKRDYTLAFEIHQWLMGEGPPPGSSA